MLTWKAGEGISRARRVPSEALPRKNRRRSVSSMPKAPRRCWAWLAFWGLLAERGPPSRSLLASAIYSGQIKSCTCKSSLICCLHCPQLAYSALTAMCLIVQKMDRYLLAVSGQLAVQESVT